MKLSQDREMLGITRELHYSWTITHFDWEGCRARYVLVAGNTLDNKFESLVSIAQANWPAINECFTLGKLGIMMDMSNIFPFDAIRHLIVLVRPLHSLSTQTSIDFSFRFGYQTPWLKCTGCFLSFRSHLLMIHCPFVQSEFVQTDYVGSA